MKQMLLASALALGAMTTVALAESVTPVDHQAGPVQLTSAQMENVTAGAVSKQQAQKHDLKFGQAKKEPNLGQAIAKCSKCSK
jgi:hypothetical protein